MADITMCRNLKCPIRKRCYRFTAKPSDYQSYMLFFYRGGKCREFWPKGMK